MISKACALVVIALLASFEYKCQIRSLIEQVPLSILELIETRGNAKPQVAGDGFSLIELVVVIAILAILLGISLPLFFLRLIEDAEVARAKTLLIGAHKECRFGIAGGDADPTYTIPPNTSYFQFPDLGDDGKCLSPTSGNILTAARTAYGQVVSNYNLNINVVTGEKSTERSVPSYIIWE